jgi:hypothetical protein
MKKLPIHYPIESDDFDGLTSYQILGVKQTDTIEHIDSVYKKLITALHPDKALTDEAKRLGWTNEEKINAFNNVRRAYKLIKESTKVINVPDYNINYTVNNDFKINSSDFNQMHHGPNGSTGQQVQFNRAGPVGPVQGARPVTGPRGPGQAPIGPGTSNGRGLDTVKFNKQFDTRKQKEEIDGFGDPYSIGYNDFFKTSTDAESELEKSMIKKGLTRPNIDVVKNPVQNKRKMNQDGTLVRFEPLDVNNFNTVGNIDCSILGLDKVSDYSVKLNCGISGTDLMSAYGSNDEYWEDSVRRDPSLYERFNDTTKIDKKMNSHLVSRTNYDPKTIDPEIARKIEQEEQRRVEQQFNRNMYLQKKDQFLNQSSIGYI